VPQGAVARASAHDQLTFKQFRPTHLKPQTFNTLANVDKMKQFIEKFAQSETVKKEVGSVENFQKWLETFNFEEIPYKAIDELI